jgi:hypothetical protein
MTSLVATAAKAATMTVRDDSYVFPPTKVLTDDDDPGEHLPALPGYTTHQWKDYLQDFSPFDLCKVVTSIISLPSTSNTRMQRIGRLLCTTAAWACQSSGVLSRSAETNGQNCWEKRKKRLSHFCLLSYQVYIFFLRNFRK